LIVGDGSIPEICAALATKFPKWASYVRRGTGYIGFGAGAALTARHVIAGGWKFQGNQVAPEQAAAGLTDVTLLPGMGLIGLGVEPHADVRFTTTRAIAALHADRLTSAMALDEKVCLAVDALTGQTKVLGGGRVCWLTRHGKQTVVRFEAAPVRG
jgi:cyanophycinase-like exopeptidase